MLRDLYIQNLAIIDEARIEFGAGLNVLTGETGAGKSLLVGALELVWGERARGDWISAGAEEAQVEAVFDCEGAPGVSAFLAQAGFPADDTVIIRRTVSRSGKNRIFVNDRAATLGFLEGLGARLVDIHGQHEHQSLLNVARQRELVDLYGGLVPLQKKVDSLYGALRHRREELERLESEHRRMAEEQDLLSYQLEELLAARFVAGEEEELEQELQKLLHVERLRETCQEVEHALYSAEDPTVDRLSHLHRRLEDTARIDPQLSESSALLLTAQHCLEEAAQNLQRYGDTLEGDPDRLSQIEERLALIARLKRKHHRSLEELLVLQEDLGKRMHRLDHFDQERKKLAAEIEQTEEDLVQAAEELSSARQQTAERLQGKVETELRAVGMKETGFMVDCRPLNESRTEKGDRETRLKDRRISPFGLDRIEFLIRPNPGQPEKPLHRIASGGELSRIMLALRNVLRLSDQIGTLVFDEVDAGIGGAEAEAVGSRLKALSQSFQIICITHLPQLAVFGDRHLKVTKQVRAKKTRFQLETLNQDGREAEVARMLAGANITQKTLAHARELLQQSGDKGPPP